MKSICVFCGSRKGNNPLFADTARDLASELVNRGITLVYGGGSIGLMGILANEVMKQGGEVIGVIPHFLDQREVGHHEVSELIVVKTMHERKAKMESISDGFITLPGGMGTLDETVEILTWAQLGLHQKPVGILNIAGYYRLLEQYFDFMVEQGYLNAIYRKMALIDDSPEALLQKMTNYTPPQVTQWMDETQT